ncbi:hypothetical protein FWF48_02800 [Candidatus Saccharibacteria bacterium]|nr:hypothetical protein [Candidatus Saccharibacteria bacterium]
MSIQVSKSRARYKQAFSKESVNKITGTRYDPDGFDRDGYHEVTGTLLNQDYMDCMGRDWTFLVLAGLDIDRLAMIRSRYDGCDSWPAIYNLKPEYIDIDGRWLYIPPTSPRSCIAQGGQTAWIHHDTLTSLNPMGKLHNGEQPRRPQSAKIRAYSFRKDGTYIFTNHEYDLWGFDCTGRYRNGTFADPSGNDCYGRSFETLIVDSEGRRIVRDIHTGEGTKLDEFGFLPDGINYVTGNLYGTDGFDINGVDEDGFKREWGFGLDSIIKLAHQFLDDSIYVSKTIFAHQHHLSSLQQKLLFSGEYLPEGLAKQVLAEAKERENARLVRLHNDAEKMLEKQMSCWQFFKKHPKLTFWTIDRVSNSNIRVAIWRSMASDITKSVELEDIAHAFSDSMDAEQAAEGLLDFIRYARTAGYGDVAGLYKARENFIQRTSEKPSLFGLRTYRSSSGSIERIDQGVITRAQKKCRQDGLLICRSRLAPFIEAEIAKIGGELL